MNICNSLHKVRFSNSEGFALNLFVAGTESYKSLQTVWPGCIIILLAEQLQGFILISLKIITENFKICWWIISFTKFGEGYRGRGGFSDVRHIIYLFYIKYSYTVVMLKTSVLHLQVLNTSTISCIIMLMLSDSLVCQS